MALSLENANLVRQKVKIALANAHPVIQEQFKDLLFYLATQRGNIDLQFVPFTEVQADAAGGTAVVDAACKLYGVFVKKENSATDNFFWAYDDATNDGTAADARVSLPLLVANAESVYVEPRGLDMAAGVVVTQYATDALGAVDGSNGGDGFLIIGAA
jgi:hypothetical protein